MTRRWLPGLAALVALAGCTTYRAIPAPATPPPQTLVAYQSCAQLLDELRTATQRSVGPFGMADDNDRVRGPMPAGAQRAAEQAPAPRQAPPAFSGTNVNEAGIDEPDVVKTDGRRIVAVDYDGVLHVVDVTTRAETGKLDLNVEFGTAQLLLGGDRALVLISRGGIPPNARFSAPVPDRFPRSVTERTVEILLVDLAGPPRLISRYRSDARLVDARQTGTVTRVVLSNSPQITFPMRAASTEGLIKENRAAVAEAPVQAWLPSWTITTGGDTTRGRLDCGSVSRPTTFSGTSMLSVLTFDLNASALDDGKPVGIVADGNTVYATATSLYVANDQRWLRSPQARATIAPPVGSEIFRFALAGTARPTFAASGTVPGTILNQYAMSEWDGYLRIATTDPATDSSAVRVLREIGGTLTQVGLADGLGKGERIYSVRFLGPRGYVVTFRQTDPLYALDLRDPTRPHVTGALKINGYSSHLQQVGPDRLIGIGYDATSTGTVGGLQISLFDVSDPANPRRLAQQKVPDASSEADNQPHAVLWWPATNLLVLPISTWKSSAALMLRVEGETLRTVGEMDPTKVGNRFTKEIRREFVTGDVLWTLTNNGLAAMDLSTVDRIAWISFG